MHLANLAQVLPAVTVAVRSCPRFHSVSQGHIRAITSSKAAFFFVLQ